MKKTTIFVAGIGTNVGKTVVSAVLRQALAADYWKPIQAGTAEGTDSERVADLFTDAKDAKNGAKIWPARHLLQLPASPHFAAAAENVRIEIADFELPKTENHLIVEGAGGLMVPLNERDLLIDLMVALGLPVVLVVGHYLGAINHAILSVEALRGRGLEILGLVFSGDNYNDNEEIIMNITKLPCLFRLPQAAQVTPEWVAEQAAKIDVERVVGSK